MDRGQGAQEQQGNRRVEPEDLRAPRQVQATTVATSANERRPDVEGAPWQQAQGQHGLARQPQECQALNKSHLQDLCVCVSSGYLYLCVERILFIVVILI